MRIEPGASVSTTSCNSHHSGRVKRDGVYGNGRACWT